MAGDFDNSNLGGFDPDGQYPSAASPLDINELLKSRAVSAPPPSSWMPPAWAPDKTGVGPAAARPASQAAPTTPDYSGLAVDQLKQGSSDLSAAEKVAQSAPPSSPQLDSLNQRIAADSVPTQLRENRPEGDLGVGTGKIKPEFAPSLGSKIWRGVRSGAIGLLTGGIPGAIVGALEPQDIRGGTAYSTPNKAYGQEEADREATLSTLEGQRPVMSAALQRAIDARKQQVDDLTKLGENRSTTIKNLADLQKGNTGQEKSVAQLREHGLMHDADGNIVPVPREQMTPAETASLDLKDAQQELADAHAELFRQQGDPNSPAYKLAMQRVATAAQNASAATTRAYGYVLNATGANLGTDPQGNPLQGATEIGGKTVGSRFQTTVQKQQGQVAQFNDVLGATDQLEASARQLVKTQGAGALSSPIIAAAMNQPDATAFQAWIKGRVGSTLSPAQRNYVTNLHAFRENLQALRKAAGGGVSDAQVQRLMEMAPSASTPDLDYLLRQTGQIRQTAQRLSKGIPNVVGGVPVQGASPAGGGGAAPPAPGAPDASGFWNSQPKKKSAAPAPPAQQ